MIHPGIVPPNARGSSSRGVVVAVALLAIAILLMAFFMRPGAKSQAVEGLAAGDAHAVVGASDEIAASDSDDALHAHAGADALRAGAVPVGVRVRGNGKLDGRVIDRASAIPVGGVRVDLVPVPPAGAAFLGRLLPVMGMQTDLAKRVKPVAIVESAPDGSFHFEGVRPGTYYIDARGTYHVPENVVSARVTPSGSGGPIDVYVRTGGRIVGTVLDIAGQPAKGATLTLVPGPGEVITSAATGDLRLAETVSDENGRFAFPGVPPGEDYEITANPTILGIASSRFALSYALAISVKPEQDTEVIVQTRPGGTITGRVLTRSRDGEPTPLANAHLGVVPRGLRSLRCIGEVLLATHAVTGADGSFTIEHAPPGELDVLAAAMEHLPAVGAHVYVDDLETAHADDIVLDIGPTVRGTIVDSQGEPLAGVGVKWNPIDWKKFNFDFSFAPLMLQAIKGVDLPKTGPDGKFFAGPIAGEPDFSVDFECLGFAAQTYKWNPERDGSEVTITMRRGGAVEGLVMDEVLAEPVTSFTITSTNRIDTDPEAPGAKNPFSGGQLVEDPNGKFRIDYLEPGPVLITFTAPGYLPRTIDEVTVVEGETSKGLIVKLKPGGIVKGRVVDSAGKPIAGAQVIASAENSANADKQRERMRTRRRMTRGSGARGPFGEVQEGNPGDMFPPGMSGFAASLGLLGDRAVQSNAQGEFTLKGVDAGTFQVQAFHRDHANGSTPPLTMTEAGLLENVLVTLTKGGGIEGTVKDRHGRPVAQELVLAFSPAGFGGGAPAGGASGSVYQGHSDKDGHYAIAHVAPGSYFLVATRGDADLNPMSFFGTLNFDLVNVPPDEVVNYDLLDTSAGGCRVYGTVTYKGEPVTRGNLGAVNFETESLLGVEFKLARIDDKGNFEFAGLAPGDYQLNLDNAGPQVRMTLEVPDQPELRLDLALPEGGIEGRVVDEATGKPVSGAEVSLRPMREEKQGSGLLGQFISREGRQLRDFTDGEGKFGFERLEAQDYELSARGPRGDGKGQFAPSGKLKVDVGVNRTERDIEIRLPAAMKIAGRVIDDKKAPVKGANIFVRLANGGFESIERGRSDDDGHFEIAGLGAGTYNATVNAKGYAEGKKDGIVVKREGAAPSETEIVIQKGVKVIVIVYGTNGAPASGARADMNPVQGKKEADPSQAERVFSSLFTGEGTSDSEGRIDLGRFLPGEYRLEASRGLSKGVDPKVVIPAGEDEVEVRINLR